MAAGPGSADAETAWRWLPATGSALRVTGAEPAAQGDAATAVGTVSGPGEDGENTAADTGGTDATQCSGMQPAAPADRASQGLEVYGDSQYGRGEARAASGKPRKYCSGGRLVPGQISAGWGRRMPLARARW
jgi:hypothetical protein